MIFSLRSARNIGGRSKGGATRRIVVPGVSLVAPVLRAQAFPLSSASPLSRSLNVSVKVSGPTHRSPPPPHTEQRLSGIARCDCAHISPRRTERKRGGARVCVTIRPRCIPRGYPGGDARFILVFVPDRAPSLRHIPARSSLPRLRDPVSSSPRQRARLSSLHPPLHSATVCVCVTGCLSLSLATPPLHPVLSQPVYPLCAGGCFFRLFVLASSRAGNRRLRGLFDSLAP